MIVITGQIFTDKQTLPDLYDRLKALCAPTRAEDGCVFYHMAMEDEAEGVILATEGWRDMDALQAHLATPDIVKLLADFDGKFSNDIRVHEASVTRALAI